MTATSVTFSTKVASDWDPQKPLTTSKLNQLYNNTTNLHERLGGDYTSNTKNHTHDGSDSALIPIGPNYLRNGSFEDGLTGWTVTQYTGGTVASSTTNFNGAKSLAITSTVLANGGGDVVSNEFVSVTEGSSYDLKGAIKASVANISCKAEIIWYDSAKAQISISPVFSSVNTPTVLTSIGGNLTAPSNTRFMKQKLTGAIPATGTATGTIYFDGFISATGGYKLVKYTRLLASNASWPRQIETTFMMVACLGGGGGGGGGDNSYSGSGGAAAPGFNIVSILNPATTFNAIVGAGGIGTPANSVSNGGDGGTSSFGGVAIGYGGIGGSRGTGAIGRCTKGIIGGDGSAGFVGGDGANSCIGVGGVGASSTGGSAAANTGAGGGGSLNSSVAAGNGGSGVIDIWEYA